MNNSQHLGTGDYQVITMADLRRITATPVPDDREVVFIFPEGDNTISEGVKATVVDLEWDEEDPEVFFTVTQE